MKDLWYKDAIIYYLDVETYQDSNGDGIGGFAGLIQCLDYIANLGVTSLLHTANPAVREEIKKIIAFWLELGLSGGWCPLSYPEEGCSGPRVRAF